jgi:predicted peroxiredoxin
MDTINHMQPLGLDPPAGACRQKLTVVLASGPEDGGTRATLALCAAVTGLCLDQDVVVFLIGDRAYWAYEGRTHGIQRNGFPALETLMENLLELGGEIHVCSACDQVCGILDAAVADPPRRRPEIRPRGLAAVLGNLVAAASVTF